jgi:6-pyruvoyltetrahydropterin/6-carboxytetrahydropterin synthase
MFDIFIKTHFAGAHHLRDYPGECELPHGHNWKVKVTVRAKEVDEIGMGIDFKLLKKHVKAVIDRLDHRDLNVMDEFAILNPSSEHIAVFIFNNLVDVLRHDRYFLYSVRVMETDTSGLTYYGGNAASR